MNSVLRALNREMAPERVILTQNSCVWTPGWSEEHSLDMSVGPNIVRENSRMNSVLQLCDE